MPPPRARPSIAPLHYIPNFLFFKLIFNLDEVRGLLPCAALGEREGHFLTEIYSLGYA